MYLLAAVSLPISTCQITQLPNLAEPLCPLWLDFGWSRLLAVPGWSGPLGLRQGCRTKRLLAAEVPHPMQDWQDCRVPLRPTEQGALIFDSGTLVSMFYRRSAGCGLPLLNYVFRKGTPTNPHSAIRFARSSRKGPWRD